MFTLTRDIDRPKRIAMWSGPRNLSTALMYSFGARADCSVVDEPFYASYLHQTGLDHPMRDDILSIHEIELRKVIQALTRPIQTSLQYQKHMAHHMLPGISLDWAEDCQNVFLIRHPVRVLASYARKHEAVSLEDIGIVQQVALYHRFGPSIVIDSADIRDNPRKMLGKLTQALGVCWDDKMLSWPKGGHAQDGVWAKHWYGAVHASTGFSGPEGPLPELPEAFQSIADAAMPYYLELVHAKLQP